MRAPSLTKTRSRCRSGAWWPWCLLWVCCVPFAGSITRTQLRRELGIEVITVSATPASVLAACLCAQHARICGPARRDYAGAWWRCSSRRETTAKISLPTAAAYAVRLFRRPTRCGTAKNIASHHRAHPLVRRLSGMWCLTPPIGSVFARRHRLSQSCFARAVLRQLVCAAQLSHELDEREVQRRELLSSHKMRRE